MTIRTTHKATIIYMDRDYYGQHFTFECEVKEADMSDMIDQAADEFHSSNMYTEWADQYTAEEMGELDEFRFEIFATIIGDAEVHLS